MADKTTSDCGATVLANYQQTPITRNPNLEEPIGFDQLPDGRIIQTSRRGTVRLHNPSTGTTTTIADLSSTSVPTTLRVYTNSEDGLYGPAVDPNFATNHWVYLYYAPQTVTNVKLSDGSVVTQTTPNTTVPNSAPSPTAWDPYVGYFQLSRFKFVDGRDADAGPLAPSSRSCGSPTTARSAATSPATSTSTRPATCGWSRVTTRRPAASAPTATVRSRTS